MILLAQETTAATQNAAVHLPTWIPGWGVSILLVIAWLMDHFKVIEEHRKLHNEIHKLKEESLKLREETIKLAGETLRNLQESRGRYEESCALASQHAESLRSLLIPDADKSRVDQARLVLCSSLLDLAIPHYLRFCEWEHLRRKTDSARLKEFLTEAMVQQMRRFTDWLEIVNLGQLIVWLGRNPALVDRETLRPFLDMAQDLNQNDKDFVLAILRQEIDRMVASGRRDLGE